MEHLFGSSASIHSAAPALAAAAAAQLHVQVPFPLRASLSITDHGGPFFLPALNNHATTNIPATGPFELSFTLRADALEDVAVDSSATGATCSGGVDVRAPTVLPTDALMLQLMRPPFPFRAHGFSPTLTPTLLCTGTDYGMTASLRLIFPPTPRESSALI
ncbi:hypothetical protein EDB89DRAFT_302586 [Lactarius sanguifluus]|nr:hypothetical protein EDB89DRAFT_302586 [Lactarius sanguifluus]